MPFPLRVSFPCFSRARQTEPHKRARKLSRVERELASLAPWAWDPLVGKHAPGNAMMRDFAEVAADKVVTTNTDTYDAFRFAAPETNAETKETSAKKRDRTRASSVAVAATALDREPPRSIPNRKARSARPPANKQAVGRSPLSRLPATAASEAPAPSTAPRVASAAGSKSRLSPVDATPLGSTQPARSRPSGVSSANPSRAKMRERADPADSGSGPGSGSRDAAAARSVEPSAAEAGSGASRTPARAAKKSKPRSAVTRTPRFAVGKNLVDALERAVEAPAGPGKENAPPPVGANGEAPNPAPASGPAAGARMTAKRADLPLADLCEARRHREAALLAVAAAEAEAAAAASGPAMTPSQRLLRAYYDLTGSRAAAAARRDGAEAAARAAPAATPPISVPPFDAASRPVCVTVGPFPGAFEASCRDAFERRPARVVPLTATVARACDYLGRRDAEEARRGRS